MSLVESLSKLPQKLQRECRQTDDFMAEIRLPISD